MYVAGYLCGGSVIEFAEIACPTDAFCTSINDWGMWDGLYFSHRLSSMPDCVCVCWTVHFSCFLGLDGVGGEEGNGSAFGTKLFSGCRCG
jgi:hypothetical protein